MVRFDLKVLSFMVLLWGVFNFINGIIVLSHDWLVVAPEGNFWIITGIVRLMIGTVAMIISWYIWRCADKIAIFERKDVD